MKQVACRIALMMYIKLGKPQRRAGGYFYHMKNKVRYNLQIVAYMQRKKQEQNAKMIIIEAFSDLRWKQKLEDKFQFEHEKVLKIKKRFKDKIDTKQSKIEVLCL